MIVNSKYEVIFETHLKDIKSDCVYLRHKKTGMKILLLPNDDNNKVFWVSFRTPVENSTGVAHIMEHSVLCGSDKYPVKDPFIELVKGSLNTFLNAVTYPDKTMYPLASTNDKDFNNLMSVYMDAVFNPKIYEREEIFLQEGWHYELNDPSDELNISGVVYNEMKGAYSSAHDILFKETMTSLFKGSVYDNDSGGNPECIPDLTFEDFKAFHKKYYHPSNGRIYIYGDVDMDERLNWLDKEYLSKYEKMEIDSEIKDVLYDRDELFHRAQYPLTDEDAMKNGSYLSYNVALDISEDPMLYAAFDVLNYALVNAAGAPISKALYDAGIGMDITASFISSLKNPVFSITASNVEKGREDEFVEIIENCLKKALETGVNDDALLAGINQQDFEYREADYGTFPKGLMYSLTVADAWNYDDENPVKYLNQLEMLAVLRDKIDTGYYKNIIKDYILNNKHKSVVVLEPDMELSKEQERKFREKLDKYKAGLSDEEINKLVEMNKNLRKYQDEPSTAEELKTIPMLKRSDISETMEKSSNIEASIGDVKVLEHDFSTNGIVYLDLLYSADFLKEEDIPYLTLLSALLSDIDVEKYSYNDLQHVINSNLGDLNVDTEAYYNMKDESYSVKLQFKMKALYKKLSIGLELIEEIVKNSDFSDLKRIKEIVKEEKSNFENRVIDAGHTAAAGRAMAEISRVHKVSDALKGLAYYEFIADLYNNYDEKAETTVNRCKEILSQIISNDNLLVSLTAEEQFFDVAEKDIKKAINSMDEFYKDSAVKAEGIIEVEPERKNEAFIAPSSTVQYVGSAGRFNKTGKEKYGLFRLYKVLMSYNYLWNEVRVKGGAYGCAAMLSKEGLGFFTSYRDPRLAETLETYKKTGEYLKNMEADEREMLKYIIGTISVMDTPFNANQKGRKSLVMYLSGITDADVLNERKEILNATVEDIRALENTVNEIIEDSVTVVIGSEKKIMENKDKFDKISPLFL